MDINEHERLSNISQHLKMRAKQQHVCKEMDQYMINQPEMDSKFRQSKGSTHILSY
jgi:hypothetical protein